MLKTRWIIEGDYKHHQDTNSISWEMSGTAKLVVCFTLCGRGLMRNECWVIHWCFSSLFSSTDWQHYESNSMEKFSAPDGKLNSCKWYFKTKLKRASNLFLVLLWKLKQFESDCDSIWTVQMRSKSWHHHPIGVCGIWDSLRELDLEVAYRKTQG